MTSNLNNIWEKKMNDHFKRQRPLKNGRHFLWNSFRRKTAEDMKSYRDNFDRIFKNSPGNGF